MTTSPVGQEATVLAFPPVPILIAAMRTHCGKGVPAYAAFRQGTLSIQADITRIQAGLQSLLHFWNRSFERGKQFPGASWSAITKRRVVGITPLAAGVKLFG